MMFGSKKQIICTVMSEAYDVKGGENKMEKTQWEILENCSKEDLIIELVKERSKNEILKGSIRSFLDDGQEFVIPDIGERPTREWLDRILGYVKEHEPENFSAMDLLEYGVDYDTANELWTSED